MLDSPPESPNFPQAVTRKSLIDHTADTLRDHIALKTWANHLPSERRLCEMLAVSRPTLRSAFKILEAEGLLAAPQERIRHICTQDAMKEHGRPQSAEIAILCPVPTAQMLPPALYLIDELYARFQKIGYKVTVYSPAWLNFKNPEPYIAQHVQEHPARCRGLFSVSEAAQKWFSARAMPAVVSGSCYPTVPLPSLDFDNRAVTAHAVGVFLRHGHRRITLLQPETNRPGDEAVYTGFSEAIHQSRHLHAEGFILRVSSKKEIFEKQLMAHLKKFGEPLALLIPKPPDALQTICLLLQKQITIGKQVAIICNGDDFYLDYLSPKLARYRIKKDAFVTKLFQLLLKLAESKALPARATLLTPSFEPRGDSLT